MALSIGNTSPAGSYRLQQRDQQLALNLAKLNSGSKLNRAADGPAALIISEQLRAQLEGLRQASDNLSQGINQIQTADAGLEATQGLLQRQRELALQASSTATTDPAQLAALEEEFQNLGQSIDRIAGTTQYAGQKLLDGSFQGRQLQSGAEGGQQVDVTIASQATGSPAGFDRAGLGTAGTSLTAPGGAAAALTAIDTALTEVGAQRGNLGALQTSTLESMRSSLAETTQNLAGARSTIADVDFAEETANLVRNQILANSAVAARTQQNVTAGTVLRLLGG